MKRSRGAYLDYTETFLQVPYDLQSELIRPGPLLSVI